MRKIILVVFILIYSLMGINLNAEELKVNMNQNHTGKSQVVYYNQKYYIVYKPSTSGEFVTKSNKNYDELVFISDDGSKIYSSFDELAGKKTANNNSYYENLLNNSVDSLTNMQKMYINKVESLDALSSVEKLVFSSLIKSSAVEAKQSEMYTRAISLSDQNILRDKSDAINQVNSFTKLSFAQNQEFINKINNANSLKTINEALATSEQIQNQNVNNEKIMFSVKVICAVVVVAFGF